MNYVWEVSLQADKQGMSRESLQLVRAEEYSPYLEVAFDFINAKRLETTRVEMNPLYSYSNIFSELFRDGGGEMIQTKDFFLNVVMHYLIQVDLRQGLCRQEYYKRFLLRDILEGVLGADCAQAIRLYRLAELWRIMPLMLELYNCGSSLHLFRKAIHALYADAIVYGSNDQYRELFLYVGQRETEWERQRIGFLLNTFLAFNYTVHLFWEHHFGIIDVEATMEADQMVLF